jgi:hypothetical protein
MEKKTITKKPTIESLRRDIEDLHRHLNTYADDISEINEIIADMRRDEIFVTQDTLEDIENRLECLELHDNNHKDDNKNELRELRKNVDYCLEKLGERVEKCEKTIEQFSTCESNPATKPATENTRYIDPAKVAALIDKGISVKMKITLLNGEIGTNGEDYLWFLGNHHEECGGYHYFYDSKHKTSCCSVSECGRHILEAYELKEIPIL